MNTELQKNIMATFNELQQVLSSFKEEQINVIPFENSWTAGQVAEHIIKSVSGLPEIVNGNSAATQRRYDEKIEAIKKLFLDFSIKMQSPEFIRPLAPVYIQKNLLSSFEKLKTEIMSAVETCDLTVTFPDFELPAFGTLTRFEWANFSLIHTQRHIQQLRNIYQSINKKSSNNSMTQINSYLTFNGNCRDAMTFYKECLGGELTLQTIGESPLSDKMPSQMKECILHSTLKKDALVLMGSDMVSEQGFTKGNTVSLMLNCSSEEEIKTSYTNLSAGGQATHPLEDTFWGAVFGDLTDKFGNHWLLHYDKNKKE